MGDYKQKLLDPRWQKKRLEILQRDDFKCRCCDDNTTTLHVHHIYYGINKNPWDYDDLDLVTLCETCHKLWHRIFDDEEVDPSRIIILVNLYDEIEGKQIEMFMDKNKNTNTYENF